MKKIAKKLPDTPGVYFFLGRRREILYIGKATSLKSRVRSYFAADLNETRGSFIANMVTEAVSIDFRKTDSVLEAIILEADLIKKFQPRFNTKEKDDKSFNCVSVTSEDFPRIIIVREKDLETTIQDLACPNDRTFGQAGFQCLSRYRSASIAAIQPVPAAVTACR